MFFKVPSYKERVINIKRPEDISLEINKAKRVVSGLRTKSKKAELLDDKIKIQKAVKEAESVVHSLRNNYFAIEDNLNGAVETTNEAVSNLESKSVYMIDDQQSLIAGHDQHCPVVVKRVDDGNNLHVYVNHADGIRDPNEREMLTVARQAYGISGRFRLLSKFYSADKDSTRFLFVAIE